SRRRHTRFSRDWSSDVCSSDLSASTAYKEGYHRRLPLGQVVHELLDPVEVLVVDPIHHKAIRCIQAQLALTILHLQRTNPGIELLGRKLIAQEVHAWLPEYNRH